MSIESEEDVIGLKKCGRVVGLTLREMSRHVKPGITTGELDRIGEEFLRRHEARSAPRLTYNFPGSTCISINDEAAHGIPGNRVIQPGDLVNIDVSAELDGYFTDTGATFAVPPVSPTKQKLMDCTKAALNNAIAAAKSGQPMNVIGQAVEAQARRCGFAIIKNLAGHGVGRGLHEQPSMVLNYSSAQEKRKLSEGLVFTIEPFLSTGADFVLEAKDGWTLKTPDGSLLAQYEHTIIVTKGRPIVVTQV
ncbi:MAG: methionyl aminopeptidase [Chloroflexia bacterium]|jgi:methionyl aminopeptidase|nr:methionyl aminopeptidase [Chloroflexia bacterium]